ncbi:MAG: ASPIC/UnbV domain-containing protein [Caldilineaceae bacterium]
MQEVIAGSSLGAGNELTLHFGLGDQTLVTQASVIWPNGLHQTFTDLAVDRRVSLAYPVDDAANTAQRDALYAVANTTDVPAMAARQLSTIDLPRWLPFLSRFLLP